VEQGTTYYEGTQVDFDSAMANFNTSITNPEAFVPPSYCTGAPVQDSPGPLVLGLFMRFIKY
jgi:hypothetical protein